MTPVLFNSAVLPGATCSFRRVGAAFRNRLELKVSEARHAIRVGIDDYTTYVGEDLAEKPTNELPPEKRLEARRQIDHLFLLQQGPRLAFCREMVVAIHLPEGEYQDITTIDQQLEEGPESFTAEILTECDRLAGFSVEETKN